MLLARDIACYTSLHPPSPELEKLTPPSSSQAPFVNEAWQSGPPCITRTPGRNDSIFIVPLAKKRAARRDRGQSVMHSMPKSPPLLSLIGPRVNGL